MSRDKDPAGELRRYYAALEGASHAMLDAARAGDWDTVCRLEGACSVVIARLRRIRREQPDSDIDPAERTRILRTIVANDAEIRRIAQPVPGFYDTHSGWSPASLRLH